MNKIKKIEELLNLIIKNDKKKLSKKMSSKIKDPLLDQIDWFVKNIEIEKIHRDSIKDLKIKRLKKEKTFFGLVHDAWLAIFIVFGIILYLIFNFLKLLKNIFHFDFNRINSEYWILEIIILIIFLFYAIVQWVKNNRNEDFFKKESYNFNIAMTDRNQKKQNFDIYVEYDIYDKVIALTISDTTETELIVI